MVKYSFTFQDLELFLAILVRVSMFVVAAPFFSMSNTLRRVKVGFACFVAIVLFSVLPKEPLEYTTVIEYAVIILKEGVTGLLIGFSASICNSIILFAGRIMDMEIGFSMVNIFDPVSKEQTSITGTFYSYMLMMLLIITDMHHFILKALVDAYQLIPINGAVFSLQRLYEGMLGFMSDYIVIGFRICLPVFAAMMLLNAILGILAKVAPQMNMFVIGMQLKILVGLGILFLTIWLLPSISNFVFTEMKKMMVTFIEAMYS